MTTVMYGSREYYEKELRQSNLELQLIREAVASHIEEGKVTTDNMADYVQILNDAQERNARCVRNLNDCVFEEEQKNDKA